MKCPFCHHSELRVTDSREALELNAIRRRRECLNCQQRFTTFETVELTLQVYKRDGRYEDFQQSKLINGLDAACRHTSISREQVIKVAVDITDELMRRQMREVNTTELVEMSMRALQRLDAIAYIRFACVYRRLKNIDQLIEAINSIPAKDDTKARRKDPLKSREEVLDDSEKSTNCRI
jgi:transcriptional repressor NrdR